MDIKARLTKDKSKRSSSKKSLPGHQPTIKVRSIRQSVLPQSSSTVSSRNAVDDTNGTTLPLESKTNPIEYTLPVPNAADMLQVGSPSDSILKPSTNSNPKESLPSNTKVLAGISSSKENAYSGSGKNHHHSSLHHSIKRDSNLENIPGSTRGNLSDLGISKSSKDGGSTTSQRLLTKHALLPWRTSTVTTHSTQEDSDDEEFIYPENHVDPRRSSGYHGYHQPYTGGTIKSNHMYLQPPDSPYNNGPHHNLMSNCNNHSLSYNAYPADPHTLRYSRMYDQSNDQYMKRPSPEGFPNVALGYGATSSYNSIVNHHYLHQHMLSHPSSYYNEMLIPDNIDSERVTLLGKTTHHNRPEQYWSGGAVPVHQQNGRRVLIGRLTPKLILTVLLLILIVFPLIFLCVRPLADTSIVRVHNINGTSDLYEFDLLFAAANPNILPISIKEVDLDILVSAHLHSSRHGHDDDINHAKSLRSSKNGHDERSATEELLGHIKLLDTPITFPSLAHTNATGHGTLEDPFNTLGKLLYMLGTYTLQLRGTLTYHTMFFVPYAVPVCTVHVIERGKVRNYEPCNNSQSDDDNDENDASNSQ